MSRNINERLFSFMRRLFFEDIGPKFRVGTLKNLMDILFVIFEKLCHNFDFISRYYLDIYQEIVGKEIKLAKISSKDNILVIGCGSLPTTSVLIAMKADVDIVAIDNDSKAVKEAINYTNKHHFENRIKVEHADGLFYSIEKFDVIFVLYGVKRQKELFRHLAKNMKNTARIIFRTAIDTNGQLTGEKIVLSNYFIVKDCIRSKSLGLVDSFLLFKKT
jgi:2-polyprenyl-3-methyl-5-hydroxy-6-metoxy-1,4-benzoquinol methylase